jgi:hypothetical protein
MLKNDAEYIQAVIGDDIFNMQHVLALNGFCATVQDAEKQIIYARYTGELY